MSKNKHSLADAGRGGISVNVDNDNFERSMRIFKKRYMTDGILKEVRERVAFEKPSDKKRRKRKEAIRRRRKEQSAASRD